MKNLNQFPKNNGLIPQKYVVIYQIISEINDRRYIGCTRNPHSRMLAHRSDLRRNVHSARLLQKDFNAYGEGSFRLEAIWVFQYHNWSSKEQKFERARKLERELIIKLLPEYNNETRLYIAA